MKMSDDVLATRLSKARAGRGLSQAELAEIAKVSTKTIQRLEGGQSVSARSRRNVLHALGLDPTSFGSDRTRGERPAAWHPISDAKELFELVRGTHVEVDVEEEGGRRGLEELPWYRKPLIVVAIGGDPVKYFLELVDELTQIDHIRPAVAAQKRLDLSAAVRNLDKCGWKLAGRRWDVDRAELFIGSLSAVQEKTATSPN